MLEFESHNRVYINVYQYIIYVFRKSVFSEKGVRLMKLLTLLSFMR